MGENLGKENFAFVVSSAQRRLFIHPGGLPSVIAAVNFYLRGIVAYEFSKCCNKTFLLMVKQTRNFQVSSVGYISCNGDIIKSGFFTIYK